MRQSTIARQNCEGILKKRKCKHCGSYVKNGIVTPLAHFCSYEHATEYARIQANKRIKKIKLEKEKQERRERKERKDKLKDRRWYLKKAQQVFNAWVRDRDKVEPCISCQRFFKGQREAGHYRTTKAAGNLRFDEDNCHVQCHSCNHHKSGNVGEYRIGLIKKIGLERVERLENARDAKRWTVEELKEIIEKYKV